MAAGFRRRRRHLFAWLILGGGALLLGLVAFGVAHALGLTGLLASAYSAAALAVLPSSVHAGFQALPGIVHVLIAAGAVAVIVGLAGELFD